MSTRTSRKRAHTHPPDVVQKPRGTFHPRVQEVGPEHFGIVAVDCAKARFCLSPGLQDGDRLRQNGRHACTAASSMLE